MLLTRRLYPGGRLTKLLSNHFAGKTTAITPADHHDVVAVHDDHEGHDDHGHHHKPYDWRDDYSKNLDFEENPLYRGTPDPREYEYPYQAEARAWVYSHPAQYNPKDLRQTFYGAKHVGPLHNEMRAPVGDIQADIAHEYDYESEDVDFQPQSFKTQHFRKKGRFAMWMFVGMIPYLYVINEFYIQKFPDENHWRLQRPPPFEYPDAQDTPDTSDNELFDSPEYKMLEEAGLVGSRFFKLEGGKKVYLEGTGVNQPMQEI